MVNSTTIGDDRAGSVGCERAGENAWRREGSYDGGYLPDAGVDGWRDSERGERDEDHALTTLDGTTGQRRLRHGVDQRQGGTPRLPARYRKRNDHQVSALSRRLIRLEGRMYPFHKAP
jgi:hypothetical protein